MELGGRPHLSVVIPAYNEASRIGDTLESVLGYLAARQLEAEVLVVDDGSVDGTADVASAKLRGRRGRVISSVENRGKGHALRRGIDQASGRWVLVSDADLSTPIEQHAVLAEVARDRDADIVIASRALPGSKIEVRQNALREAMGKSFNRFVRSVTGLSYRDTQCGFKLMDRSRVLPVVQRMILDGFAFDVELLYVATRFGLTVVEVPVTWHNVRDTKVGLATAPPAMLRDVLRVMWRFRRGGYNP